MTLKKASAAVIVAWAAWCLWASPAHAEVQLAIKDGRLTLRATDASLRQILAEWERVGQTKIFNADRVPGEAVTLTLENVPEDQALAVLLRSISGYVAAPRRVPVANASRFDRIMVMPSVAPPRARSAPEPAPAGVNEPSAPAVFALPDVAPDGPAVERPVRIVPAPASRGPVFNPYVAPPPAEPQSTLQPEPQPPAQPAYTGRPTVPPGVSVPGMVPPAPESDQQRQSPN